MSDDTDGRRRGDSADADDARPLTAAGRRRRAEPADDGGRGNAESRAAARTSAVRTAGRSGTGGDKGAPTASRAGRNAATKASPIARLLRFLREVVAELRKVHWPTRRQIVVYTFVVLVFVSFMVALVYVLDLAFAKGVFALFG